MSTAIESNTFLRNTRVYDEQANAFVGFHPIGGGVGEDPQTGIRFRPAIKKRPTANNSSKPRVLRRINGFLKEMQGKNARVIMVDNGESYEYEMPAERLTKNGIKLANQPFQMDEVELQTDDGFFVGYHFRPLATEADLYSDPLDFDTERKRKLELIIKKFAKTSD